LGLSVKLSKKRSATANCVDQIQRRRNTGGTVSGPGRTASAKPTATHATPATNMPTRYA
jgi:hypothetical protein